LNAALSSSVFRIKIYPRISINSRRAKFVREKTTFVAPTIGATTDHFFDLIPSRNLPFLTTYDPAATRLFLDDALGSVRA
jgi:hypothetical protein